MKKTIMISLMVLMLTACTVPDASSILSVIYTPTPLPSSTSTIYVTPSSTPTITATLPTPTFTETPTLIGDIFTETPAPTDTPTSAFNSPIGGTGSLTTPQYFGFTAIQISSNSIRWGGCQPSSVTFQAHLLNPSQITSVMVWFRLKNPGSGESTEWHGAIMNGDDTGGYTYTLSVTNIPHYQEYAANSWLQFQITTNIKSVRTQPYLNSIMISQC
jgi:hypothetical protein